jgi:phosphohistidine phosphatase
MRRLLLLRHAKAMRGCPGGGDALRPLSEIGFADAKRLGRYLSRSDLLPDRILCSTALRTRQTVDALTGAWPSRPPTDYLPQLYLAETDEILSLLDAGGDRTLLVVGHNPAIAECAHRLAAQGAMGDAAHLQGLQGGFPPCALAIFEAQSSPRGAGPYALERFLRPDELP